MSAEPLQNPPWAPRTPQRLITRLYETDACGIVDAGLIDDVGHGLLARCESIVLATEGARGRLTCPQCRAMIAHRFNTRRDAQLQCAPCRTLNDRKDYAVHDPVYLPDAHVDARVDAMIRELLAACFLNEPKFATQRFNNDMPPHRWMIWDSGQPVAHLATHEKVLVCTGEESAFCGMAEVCVREDCRKRGFVGRLLSAAESFHAALPFAVLLGAERVYARYGYRCVRNVSLSATPDEPCRSALVKCLAASAWPTAPVVIRGLDF